MPVPPDSPIESPIGPIPAGTDLPFRDRQQLIAVHELVRDSLEKAYYTNGGNNPGGQRPAESPEDLPWPCHRWYWQNPTTGAFALYRCGKWSCPFCAPRLADQWSKTILQAPIRRHVTLTNLGTTNDEATGRLKAILKAVRRGEALGPPLPGQRRRPQIFEYFCALEGGHSPHAQRKRRARPPRAVPPAATGSPRPGRPPAPAAPALAAHPRQAGIHAHLLQHGRSLPQRHLSSLAARYGAGAVVWVRSISPDELPARVVEYVVDHLVGVVHPDQPKLGRRIRYSKNFWEGRRRIDIHNELWPPRPSEGKWELIQPDIEIARLRRDRAEIRRQADQSLAWDLRSAARDDARIESLCRHGATADQLVSLGLAFPTP